MSNYHLHKQHELLLVLGGGGALEVGDRKYEMRPGDLFLLNSQERHRTTGEKNGPYERFVLQFDPECFAGVSEALGYNFTMFFENGREDFVHRIHLRDANLERCVGLFTKIGRYAASGGRAEGPSVKFRLSILELLVFVNEIYDLFAARDRERPERGAAPGKEFGRAVPQGELVKRIKRYIMDNGEKNLYLDVVAEKFSISRYYLSRYFKKETGFTLAQYITGRKIALAMSLLDEGYSVADAARRLSFSSDTHFISVFKKNCGITPKQYAKSRDSKDI